MGVASIDLPAISRACDELSATAQREHLAGHKRLLFLLLAGAAVAALSPVGEALGTPIQLGLALVAAAVLAVGLWLTAALRTRRRAEAWYDGRAVAESAKSMAWKYMMRAEPFGGSEEPEAVDQHFCSELGKLLSDVRGHALPPAGADDAQITDTMRAIRGHEAAVRLKVYMGSRIADQQKWYASRSTDKAKRSRTWFMLLIAVNCVALALALGAAVWFRISGFLGIATTAASCCVAWVQLQRYSELAHAYSVTSHELGMLAQRSRGVADDDTLARFVADCETAFSREHTLWRARRETGDG